MATSIPFPVDLRARTGRTGARHRRSRAAPVRRPQADVDLRVRVRLAALGTCPLDSGLTKRLDETHVRAGPGSIVTAHCTRRMIRQMAGRICPPARRRVPPASAMASAALLRASRSRRVAGPCPRSRRGGSCTTDRAALRLDRHGKGARYPWWAG